MTTSKKLNPAAIIALKEASTHIYWDKNDLRSFLVITISNPSILPMVNWDTVKRNIIDAVVETLARNEKKYQDELLRLFTAVASISDFSHLE